MQVIMKVLSGWDKDKQVGGVGIFGVLLGFALANGEQGEYIRVSTFFVDSRS